MASHASIVIPKKDVPLLKKKIVYYKQVSNSCGMQGTMISLVVVNKPKYLPLGVHTLVYSVVGSLPSKKFTGYSEFMLTERLSCNSYTTKIIHTIQFHCMSINRVILLLPQ
jgi:hypothetical protein